MLENEDNDPNNSPLSLPVNVCLSMSASATQCCFDPVILVSVATQTDDVPSSIIPSTDININVSSAVDSQESYTIAAEQWKMFHDHNYSMSHPKVYPTYGFDDSSNVTSMDPLTDVEVDDVPPVKVITEIDGDDDEDKDPDWQLPKDEKMLSPDGHESEGEIESEEETESPDTEKKYLVFKSCLDQLLTHCPKCGQVVIDQKRKTIGSMLSVELTCQPTIKRRPVGNLLLAASILFTGNIFARMSRLASCLNLQFISKSVFYDTQQRFLFPILNEAWENEQKMVRQELAVKDAVNLNGDGRCDSPGHNAKYGPNKNIFHIKAWLPGHNLLPWTTMPTQVEDKPRYSQVNMLVKEGLRFVSQRPTNVGL